MKRSLALNLVAAVALILTACSTPNGATTPTAGPVTGGLPSSAPATEVPTAAPTAAAIATQEPTSAVAATEIASPTAMSTSQVPVTAGTPVAAVPEGAVVQKGKLLICTDFPYPPQEFFDENGNPQGLDIDIGTEIAHRLGLQVQFINSVFDTIIAAVKSGKCDIIISAQNITTDRQNQVSMIPYFQAGQQLVVLKGNPENINTALDLCGKSVAAESGTTEADNLQGVNDYAGKGLTQDCTKAGKQAIHTVVTQKDTDALQQLQSNKVVAYFTDSPVAAYYTVQHPDQFQLAGPVLSPAPEGISVPCEVANCTGAPLSPIGQAVQTALQSMMSDGTYTQILSKWNLTEGAVSP